MNPKNSCCTVQPIRDLKQLNDMKEYLYNHSQRDYLIFVLGINSGLRISDLLKLTVEDVATGSVTIREQKTGKTKQFALSDTCILAIKKYLESTGLTEGLLFASKYTGNTGKPVTREYVWTALNKAADYVGIKENIGTHTMRKSFGFWALRNGVDIAYIMQALNHSSLAQTKKYIGITETELNDVLYKKMNL
jgi:site-specific recombinase XerD